MSTEMISTDELSFLAKKNKEIEIEEMMTDELLEVIHYAIEKGLGVWNDSLENIVKKETEFKITDYQIANAKTFLESRLKQPLTIFMFEVVGNHGKHTLLFDKEMLEKSYALIKGHDIIKPLDEDQLDRFMRHLESGIKAFYKRFSEDMNVSVNVTAISNRYWNIQNEELSEINLDAIHEIKVYEVIIDELSLFIIHLSDATFMEYTYGNLKVETKDDFFFEDLVDEIGHLEPFDMVDDVEPLQQPQEVKKPLFSTFEEVQATNANHNLGLLYDVPLEISVVLGKTKRSIREILEINTGKIIELDKFADDPLEIYCNGKLIAEGEVVVVDENFGVKVTKLHQYGLKTIR